MGANEKLQAAMHGAQEYTPKPIDLRVAYRYMEAGLMMDPDSKPHDPVLMAESDAEFDRFIAKIHADAKAEALNDAAHALDSATINIEVLNGDLDLKQAWAFRNSERKSIIQSLRNRANQCKEQS